MRASRGRIPNINYISSKFLWQNTTADFIRWQRRKQGHHGCHGKALSQFKESHLLEATVGMMATYSVILVRNRRLKGVTLY